MRMNYLAATSDTSLRRTNAPRFMFYSLRPLRITRYEA